jgi:hypothetical protein
MTTLTTQIVDDVTAVFLSDFAEAVTINGQARQAIVLDDFDNADPRAPILRVRNVDIDGLPTGTAVVVRGVNYAIEFFRPGRFGLSEIGLVK